MRDESGEMLRNAPLLGLFRRLCKLLYLHVYPVALRTHPRALHLWPPRAVGQVLVFDGATPPLKLRTVSRRRAFRQQQEGSMRRTAERILFNQARTSAARRTRRAPAPSALPAVRSAAQGTAPSPWHLDGRRARRRARRPWTRRARARRRRG